MRQLRRGAAWGRKVKVGTTAPTTPRFIPSLPQIRPTLCPNNYRHRNSCSPVCPVLGLLGLSNDGGGPSVSLGGSLKSELPQALTCKAPPSPSTACTGENHHMVLSDSPQHSSKCPAQGGPARPSPTETPGHVPTAQPIAGPAHRMGILCSRPTQMSTLPRALPTPAPSQSWWPTPCGSGLGGTVLLTPGPHQHILPAGPALHPHTCPMPSPGSCILTIKPWSVLEVCAPPTQRGLHSHRLSQASLHAGAGPQPVPGLQSRPHIPRGLQNTAQLLLHHSHTSGTPFGVQDVAQSPQTHSSLHLASASLMQHSLANPATGQPWNTATW
nr:uncharacterized protein LOC117977335 [Pan paniscus]